ncbi:hypothetical protein [Rhizobium tubonense]|nr:hypothetical protein [Rhizobium tubonense]
MTIEQHIEELRAELRNAPALEERRQIKAELNAATEELAVLLKYLPPTRRHFAMAFANVARSTGAITADRLNTHSPTDKTPALP